MPERPGWIPQSSWRRRRRGIGDKMKRRAMERGGPDEMKREMERKEDGRGRSAKP